MAHNSQFFFLVTPWTLEGVLHSLLSAGFLFTPLCPDSLQTLQFTLCGKQDRTLSVAAFCPAGTGTDQRPKPSDNTRQPQQTKDVIYQKTVFKILEMTVSGDPLAHKKSHFVIKKQTRRHFVSGIKKSDSFSCIHQEMPVFFSWQVILFWFPLCATFFM